MPLNELVDPTLEKIFTLALIRETLSPDSLKMACYSACDRAKLAGYEEADIKKVINKLVEWRSNNTNPLDALF
jgi:hypothetical protein